jgi:hypothetical protein
MNQPLKVGKKQSPVADQQPNHRNGGTTEEHCLLHYIRRKGPAEVRFNIQPKNHNP